MENRFLRRVYFLISVFLWLECWGHLRLFVFRQIIKGGEIGRNAASMSTISNVLDNFHFSAENVKICWSVFASFLSALLSRNSIFTHLAPVFFYNSNFISDFIRFLKNTAYTDRCQLFHCFCLFSIFSVSISLLYFSPRILMMVFPLRQAGFVPAKDSMIAMHHHHQHQDNCQGQHGCL